jgi:predicted Zn-dependent protease
MDKAIMLEAELTATEILPILKMAQALAASQEQWNKLLSYANKWLKVADDKANKSQVLYMIAVSQYSLENYDRASIVLDEIIRSNEVQGLKPKENWLKLLMTNYVQIQNSKFKTAYAAQEKINKFYPSERNQKLLIDLSYSL